MPSISDSLQGRRGTKEPVDRVRELEEQLLKVQKERNDLLNDVEALCMSGDPGCIFDKSNLLGEQIQLASRELAETKRQVRQVAAERDDVAADLAAVRGAKLVADREARTARARTDALQKELNFYQQQSAAAMADRDAAAWDAEEQRRRASELEAQLRAATIHSEQQESAAAEANRGLARAKARVSDLSEQVKGLSVIPGLKQDLAEALQRCDDFQGQITSLKADLAEAITRATSTQERLDSLTAKHQASTKQLSEAGDKAAADAREVAQLKQLLDAALDRADTAEAQLSESREAVEEIKRQAEVQTSALVGARSALEAATQQKVQALMTLGDAQAAQARAEERHSAEKRRAEALAAQLATHQSDSAPGGNSPATQSPAKTPWRGWLGRGPSDGHPQSAESPDNGGGDVHALRAQVAASKDQAEAAGALAARASQLRAELAAISSDAASGEADKSILTRLDKLAEDAATLRVGLVLGINSSLSEEQDEDDMFSALTQHARGRSRNASPVNRELLDLLEAAVGAVRSQVAARAVRTRSERLSPAPSISLKAA